MGWFLGELGDSVWRQLEEYVKRLEAEGKFIKPGDLVKMVQEGPGPGTLEHARQTGLSQAEEQLALEDGTRKLVAKLEAAWTGQASDAARASVQPLVDVAAAAAKTLGQNSETVQHQVHSFEALKSSLHEVSNEPPETGFWDKAAPWTTDTEAQIEKRDQQVAANNEQYSAYVQVTDRNKDSMGLDYGQVPGYSGNDFEFGGGKDDDKDGREGDRDLKYRLPDSADTDNGHRGRGDDSTRANGFTGLPHHQPAQPPQPFQPPPSPPPPHVPGGGFPGGTLPSGVRPPPVPVGPRPSLPWGGGPGGGSGFGPRGGGGGGDFGAGTFGPGGGGIPSAGGGGGAGARMGGIPGGGMGAGGMGAGGMAGAGGGPAGGGPGAGSGSGGNAAGGARGGAPGGGMGGGGAGGGQGQGGEDTEHQRASYLQESDPDEIFGTDERTAPPVIGG